MKKAAIFFYSASGNTAQVADWISDEFRKKNISTELYPIPEHRRGIPESAQDADIYLIGTATYMWHTPPVVKKFLSTIKSFDQKPVGLFVTFGQVTVGSNLSYMAHIVRRKNGKVTGAMQLEAEHAMMFKSESPLAKGLPHENDKNQVENFVSLCIDRSDPSNRGLKKIPGLMKHFAFLAPPAIIKKFMPRLKLSHKDCTLCKKCIDACPMENIDIRENRIVHGKDCLLCYNCVRVCPEGATDADLLSMDSGLRFMSKLPEKNRAVY